jgi:hypothetical protein
MPLDDPEQPHPTWRTSPSRWFDSWPIRHHQPGRSFRRRTGLSACRAAGRGAPAISRFSRQPASCRRVRMTSGDGRGTAPSAGPRAARKAGAPASRRPGRVVKDYGRSCPGRGTLMPVDASVDGSRARPRPGPARGGRCGRSRLAESRCVQKCGGPLRAGQFGSRTLGTRHSANRVRSGYSTGSTLARKPGGQIRAGKPRPSA